MKGTETHAAMYGGATGQLCIDSVGNVSMLAEHGWENAQCVAGVLDGDVHVWTTALEVAAGKVSDIAECLAVDELGRAERYCFDRDRRRFIVARGFLRTILGLYLKCRPKEIGFRYNAYGKPQLADDSTGKGVDFNLSHSHELAVCAVTHRRRIGVDVEWTRTGFEWEGMAESIFTDRESAMIRSLPEVDRPEAFFRQWTLKEAYSKALGTGLCLPWCGFEICVCRGEAPRLRAGEDGEEWALSYFEAAPGYVGAVAVERNVSIS